MNDKIAELQLQKNALLDDIRSTIKTLETDNNDSVYTYAVKREVARHLRGLMDKHDPTLD